MVNETIIRVALLEEKRLNKDIAMLQHELNRIYNRKVKLENELNNVRRFIDNEWYENREIINKVSKEIENGGKENEE